MAKIGLEIHAYLNTKQKLFCCCKSEHGLKFSKPNTNICPICTAQPGSKPMLPNKEAVNKVIQIALILGCRINEKLIWQRKHYDWPDLPKGYQNTISGPHATPIGIKGKFEGIRIAECHLEEDPAAWNPETGEIDYNRSGSPLIEIVTEPDFASSSEVIEWLKNLITNLSYIKSIDKNAGIKADVNISLPEKKGERVEIKNINSLKNIEKALEFEIERQKKPGQTPKVQETRMFDSNKGITKLMRTKETAEDYRFISDPDLPIINLDKKRIERIKSIIPELPSKKLEKIIKKYKINKKYAEVLTKKLDLVEFFESVVDKISPATAIPWITIELMGALNYNKKELDEVNISPEHFIELLKMLEKKIITELKAKEILRKFVPESFSPKKEIKMKEHKKISDKKEIEKLADRAIKENPKAVRDYKAGKPNALNFLIGQVMKASNKRADYKHAKEMLEKELKK